MLICMFTLIIICPLAYSVTITPGTYRIAHDQDTNDLTFSVTGFGKGRVYVQGEFADGINASDYITFSEERFDMIGLSIR